MLSSRCGMAAVLKNSQHLRSPGQDLHKIKPTSVNFPAEALIRFRETPFKKKRRENKRGGDELTKYIAYMYEIIKEKIIF